MLEQNIEMAQLTELQHIPLQAYSRARQLELAATLEGKKAVYLDIKFWILLRDVTTGVAGSEPERELLHLLREAVSRNLIFCPISDSTFAELLKKVDTKSRQITADLIDELSLGVALISYDLRANTELAHFLHSALDPRNVLPLDDLVWTKLAYVVGFIYPQSTAFGPEQELTMQKLFFDHMWTISLREMIDHIGEEPLPDLERFEQLAKSLNELNTQHSGNLRTFDLTYETEVHGILDVFMEVVIDILEQMKQIELGGRQVLNPAQREAEGKQLHNLFFAAFKKVPTKQALRTLHIRATLHAAIRWNRQQRLKPNDFFDFQHAAAALGYCDAFFTERSLHSLVTARHIALDRLFSCRVGSNSEDAITYLREILSGSGQ